MSFKFFTISLVQLVWDHHVPLRPKIKEICNIPWDQETQPGLAEYLAMFSSRLDRRSRFQLLPFFGESISKLVEIRKLVCLVGTRYCFDAIAMNKGTAHTKSKDFKSIFRILLCLVVLESSVRHRPSKKRNVFMKVKFRILSIVRYLKFKSVPYLFIAASRVAELSQNCRRAGGALLSLKHSAHQNPVLIYTNSTWIATEGRWFLPRLASRWWQA